MFLSTTLPVWKRQPAYTLYFIVYTLNINSISVFVTEYEYKENGDYMCVCVFEVCIPDCKSFNIIISEKWQSS